MDTETILEKFGLSEKEAKVYMAVLELGSSTVKPISLRSGVKRTSVYNFIDELVDRGLISVTLKRGRHYYQAQSPDRLIEIERERYKKLKVLMPQFMAMYNSLKEKPKIHYYEGKRGLKQLFSEEIRAKKEILYLWPLRDLINIIGKKYLERINKERIKRGIPIKVIRHPEKEVWFKMSEGDPKYLRELRFTPKKLKYSMGFGIYDSKKIAFLLSQKENIGIMIESREMAQMMTMLFNVLWNISTKEPETSNKQ